MGITEYRRAQRIRDGLQGVAEWEAEHGAFTEEELEETRQRLAVQLGGDVSAESGDVPTVVDDLEQIWDVTFPSGEADQEASCSVSRCGEAIVLALSLRTGSDVEVDLPPEACRSLAGALLRAVSELD